MDTRLRKNLAKTLRTMFRPVVRFCVRNALSIQEVTEIQKRVFVEVAEDELKKEKQKVNVSKISALTGVHRKDVTRIRSSKSPQIEIGSITSRVISNWRQNKEFLTKANKPKVLSIEGSDCEFNQLVRHVSKDISPASVLLALEKVGAVKQSKDTSEGKVRLLAKAYVPEGNPVEIARLLASDIEDLTEAVLENIDTTQGPLPNYHAKTYYDNIAAEDLPEIKDWLIKESYKFQRKVEKYLSQKDLDYNPDENKKGGARVALGVFSRIQKSWKR